MSAQQNHPHTFEDDRTKDMNKGVSDGVSSKLTLGSNNDLCCHLMGNKSISSRDEAIAISNVDLDGLSNFPTRCASYVDASDLDFVQTESINDLTNSSNLNAVSDRTLEPLDSDAVPQYEDLLMVHRSDSFSTMNSVQLSSKPAVGEHDDKGSDSFLDCDWDNIEDFDLDGIFRTSGSIDHIFGNEMDIGDGFLTSSDHLVGGITAFVPLPDTSLCKEELFDKNLCSLTLDEQYDAKGNALPQRNQVDVQEKLSKSWDNKEEKSNEHYEIKPPKLRDSWSYKTNNQQNSSHYNYVYGTSLPYQSPDSLQRKASDEESIVCVGSSNDVLSSDSGNPSCPFPSIEEGSNIGAEGWQKEQISYFHICDKDPAKHLDYAFGYHHAERNQKEYFPCCHRYNADPAVATTPQERDVKQIQQKRKQYGDVKPDCNDWISQISPETSQNDLITCTFGTKQTCSDLTIMEKNILMDSLRIFIGNNDNSKAETLYRQLQDAIAKLDTRLSICIRDSMFRLAKSATERYYITGRRSTNKANAGNKIAANGESANKCRTRNSSSSEPDTNHVDRIVAQLLFHRPSKLSSMPIKDELS